MIVLFLIFLFLFGLAAGSFLNVVILRLNTGETLRGRSRCFACLKRLAWHDLIPLGSFFVIRGRCRYCGSKISLQYPIVEFITGCIFASVGWFTFYGGAAPLTVGKVFPYLLNVSFFSVLLAAAAYDIRHKIIPDQFSLALLIIAAVSELFALYANLGAVSAGEDFLAALGAFLFFAGLWFISGGRWMGFGDAKISFSIGLFLGFPGAILGLVLAFWSGALFGISMMILGRYGRKAEVPFAPFLAIGAYGAFLLIVSNVALQYYSYIIVV